MKVDAPDVGAVNFAGNDHEVGVGKGGRLGVDERFDLRTDAEHEIDPVPGQSAEPDR